MTRKSGTCLWALAIALWAHTASAQTAGTGGSTGSSGTATAGGNIRIELKKIGTADYPTNARANLSIPIGRTACGNPINPDNTITVTVSGLVGGNTFPYLEAWLATGNSNCNQGSRSTRVPDSANCTKLEIPNSNQVQVANRSFYDVEIKLGDTCVSEGTRPIYILQVASQNSTADATSYGVMDKLRVDTTPPDPPAGLDPGTGQTVIPLTWTANSVDTNDYFVLADKTQDGDVDAGAFGPDAGVNPGCPSVLLRSGLDFDPTSIPANLYSKNLTGQVMHEYKFNGNDFPGKKYVAATVVARDLAGNTSKMANIVCLTVTPTTGFWERYKDDGGAVEPGCACSAPGAHGARGGALAGLALVLGFTYLRSRTRRRAR